jgi:Mg/Co/Ni transporter MgtE
MVNHKIDLALAFLQSQPGSAAAVLEQQPVDYVSEFLKDVPYTHAAAVLRKMLPQYVARICNNLDPAVSASFLSAMEVSQVAAIMRHSDKGLNKEILELLPERTKIACKLLLTYAENVVGAWMEVNITTLPDDCTVEEALSRLASEDTIINSDAVHVVDRERKLQGLVGVANLLRTSSNTPITKVMEKKCDAISGRTALMTAANHPVWAHQDTVAVINRNNQMVGVLRHTDLRKGLDGISSTITASSGNDPLTGIYEVYGRSLLALFSTISEAASANRQ